MSKPLFFGVKTLQELKHKIKQIRIIAKKSNILFFAIALAIFAVMISLWDSQTTSYAHAYTGDLTKESKLGSPILKSDNELFDAGIEIVIKDAKKIEQVKNLNYVAVEEKSTVKTKEVKKVSLFENQNKLLDSKVGNNDQIGVLGLIVQDGKNKKFAEKLYEIVGDTPIKEMVPFISARDEKVAAFLVGIAKKESSFGSRSPLKDGETCYNYWGYKGAGGRGTGMGYACFSSAEEAIKVVGDRIEVLVNKERNTPARMVDTWKCGTSCAGDPGAPSWVSTVALYFNKIVG